MPDQVTVRAHAKINLSLEVLGRRSDGYHELVSVMQLIDLADVLVLRRSTQLLIRSSDPSLEGPDNLAWKAAELLRADAGDSSGCSIRLSKRIPRAAGLGGGSSDAASTLSGLNRLWGTGASCRSLQRLALGLGSDVPFFLYGGTALIEGRGERVTRIVEPAPAWYALVNPRIDVSTAEVFAELREDEWTSGAETRAVARRIGTSERVAVGVNALQSPLFRLAPDARRCFERVRALAPGEVFISGSGPTIVCRCSSATEARKTEAGLAGSGYWTAVAKSCAVAGWRAPCG